MLLGCLAWALGIGWIVAWFYLGFPGKRDHWPIWFLVLAWILIADMGLLIWLWSRERKSK
jgi:hypothetical protein